jgi:hypothetical protein
MVLRVRQHQGRPRLFALDGDVEQATVGIDHRHGRVLQFLIFVSANPKAHAQGLCGCEYASLIP